VSDLRSLLSEALVAELERLVDKRVDAALGARSQDIGSPWLSLRDCAERLHVSQRTIARLVKRGRIRTCTVGRRVLVHADDLDAAVRG
jgi:excisionase family DNA binding protein